MPVLHREDRWFERGVKEAIYVKLEEPPFNIGGGLKYQTSVIYNAVLKFFPRKLNHRSHLGSSDTSDSHGDRGSDYHLMGYGSGSHRF